ncbi:DNA translocase FtsK [Vagococcus fluvialis]|uniref:DNA translocase FtsK n=2 Tax=Vagococcus fluvialis TaxID=2738 RepID=A0A369B3S3_9ENTE|nr:DNA translocase FtsK [Vagococcus fluvialis]MDT2781434.1 DNA translocase FtsK [Vagococcus fluvialis]NKC60185.1 DNA translocase FtsK [Vagococcus fluvialis]NKD51038.1 DNA translocase FtsK [Vagococcus fluvialis]RCX15975.1 S-DNA-T family DNA segregation ATPase FtsK/SpoIIIE [Vagococcus fluvialis]RSU04150.1 cell division protein FtsK [Vagococcus fluvialis]
MAKKKQGKAKAKAPTKKQKLQQEKTTYFLIGIGFIVFGIIGGLKLGFLGILMANVFRFLVGNTFRVMSVLLVIYGVLLLFMGKDPKFKRKTIWIGGLIFYLGVLLFIEIGLFKQINRDTAIISLTWQKIYAEIKTNQISQSVGGGMIGATLYSVTYFLVSKFGSYVISFIAMGSGALLFLNIGLNDVIEKVRTWGGSAAESMDEKKQQLSERQEEKKKLKTQKEKKKLSENSVRELSPGEKLAQESQDAPIEVEQEQMTLEIDSYQDSYNKEQISRSKKAAEKPVEELKEKEQLLDFDIPEEVENIDYVLPGIDLLNEIPLTDQSKEYKLVEKNVQVLERTFDSFGVDAKVVRASLGPSVTKFEIQPAVGVKVSKIVGLTDDLALALAAKDIRMEAPIPGKSLIGIEVPNQTTSMVSFRDVIESQKSDPDKLLEVPLGRSISGDVMSADLTKMPHLLIAGSTGSGKSVCINGIISCLLMKAKPNQVKLMMIDPKMVELNVYNGVPHLLTPVVTNPRKAAQALQKVVEEMERRYELFAGFGVRNMGGYNDMVKRHNQETGENKSLLPYIVVIVDELADLMMVASNEVEDAIIRLAQMARAAGIHMILATQRPSVDVITGIIKANVPSRIAFAVSSGIDSRTIIDGNGAEKLLGRGDMLFVPMGENKPIRVQGAFISDQEVENIVEFVTSQQEADYQEHMMPTDEVETSNGGGNSSVDEYFEEAKALIVEMQTASISLLQRRFRIGYNRAARLIDELEEHGVVGPSEGSKPRKVLMTFIPDENEFIDE